jgi:hypothetical protein
MIRKTLILAAVAAALAVPSAGAFAAAPKAAPTAPAGATQAMPKYEDLHKALIASLTKMRDGMKSNPKLQGDLTALNTEVGKLPALEKAFVDAKNAGDEAAAKKAADDYATEAQKIVDIALPMDQAVNQMMQQLGMGFAQLGPVGQKLANEKDVGALLEDIHGIFKPLDAANAAVGQLHDAAAESAQNRVQAEIARIQKEEFANAVNNYLNGQAAK